MKKSQILLILAILTILPGILNAQSWGYNYNRFAISADGNNQADTLHFWPRADPDDWGATPAALAIIAKLNLKDKLVHYSYNNFIASQPHTTETNQMKLGVDGALKYWNFDESRFFDVSADNDPAIKHLAVELAKSTQKDPLYFIHMGPAEFLYRAVTKVVDEGKIEALSNVYVVSHSGYNDNHLRRGDPKFDQQPVAMKDKHHTLTEVIALSGDRIKYKKIKDQNAKWDPNELWNSEKDWSVWQWMKNHKDPSVAWIYERMLAHPNGKADISDAGMVYWLLTGDANGSPAKFEKFIGKGVLFEEAAKNEDEVEGALIVFEAEKFKLKGDWKLGTDKAYASKGKYIYFDGPNSYQKVTMDNVISYTFKVKEAGDYTVKWMMRQPEGERGTDKGNDVWIYLSDDVGYAKNQKLKHYEKFYSRSSDSFVLHGVAEIHGAGHGWLTAKFPKAGKYTINIGGRSHGLQIDQIVLFKGLKMQEVKEKLE